MLENLFHRPQLVTRGSDRDERRARSGSSKTQRKANL